jgi:Fic family protein
MTAAEPNVHILDAAYKPFPPFAEWLKRTSLDSVRWDRYNASLRGAPGISPEKLKWAANIATRAAALDTGAIENLYEVDRGFTYTVAFETGRWEIELAGKGEHVRSLFEAQLHAYDYVLDLATKAQPITEAAIRFLHEVVCKAQATYRVMTAIGPQEQPLPKGRYKSLPNHVRTRDGLDHSYAPVDVTPAEMDRLVKEMRTEAFLVAHPVVQAAYAHYAFVVIHPFADGNGRVARALASAFTYRAISMPIVILSEHKDAYLDALEAADRGEFQSFVDFMLARALDTIQLVDDSVLGENSPSAEKAITALNSLYISRGGYTQDQVDEGAIRLLSLFYQELTKLANKYPMPKGAIVLSRSTRVAHTGTSTHRPAAQNEVLTISVTSSFPVFRAIPRDFEIRLPKDPNGDDDIQIVSGEKVKFSAPVDQVIPAIGGVLQLRIAMLADRTIGEMLDELKLLAEKANR